MTKVTGELISIDDSAYDGFKGMTIYGKTVQNLWVNPNGANNGITATANADGSITVSGTPNVQGSSPTISSNRIYTLKPDTTYIAFSDKAVADEYVSDHGACFYVTQFQADDTYITDSIFALTGNLSVVFTTDSKLGYALCRITVRPNTTVSGTYRIMLREATPEEIAKAAGTPQTLPVYPDGSGPDASDEELGIMPLDEVSTLADSDFDDYWCPPGLSSIDEVKVMTAGKNLWVNPNGANNGVSATANADGSITVSGTPNVVGSSPTISSGRIYSLKPNTTYIAFSDKAIADEYAGNHGACFYVSQYQADGTYITDKVFALTGNLSVVFTTDSKLGYALCRITVRPNTTVSGTYHVQLEVGSTVTDWAAPAPTDITPVPLSGNSLRSLPDGTRDELHIDREGNCTLAKRVGAATAPTSAGSWFWETSGDDIASFSLPAKSTGTKTDMTGVMRCDKLPIRKVSGDESYAIVGTTRCHVKNPAITSAATAATVAGGAICLYQLEAPQTIQLGKISLPKLRKKPLVNNVWTNGTAEGTGFSLAPEIDYEYRRWRMGCDGVSADGQHSFWDLGGCIAARDTGVPEKKPVTATVPYMSGFYDLSDLYGAVAYDSREVMYRFEFVEDSREDLQDIKSRFLKWLANVQNAEIVDDDIPGRHLIGSFSEAEFEEGEEGESGSLEVTFLCQPFFEADEETVKTLSAGSNTVTIEGQAVNAYAKSAGTSTLKIGGVNQSVGTTEIRLSQQLKPGDNAVTVTGSAVTLRWRENTI